MARVEGAPAAESTGALARDELLFWLNSLDIADCMLVDDLAELADGRVLLSVVASLEGVALPAACTAASRVEAAIRLLGQKHGFGRLPEACEELRNSASRQGAFQGHVQGLRTSLSSPVSSVTSGGSDPSAVASCAWRPPISASLASGARA